MVQSVKVLSPLREWPGNLEWELQFAIKCGVLRMRKEN